MTGWRVEKGASLVLCCAVLLAMLAGCGPTGRPPTTSVGEDPPLQMATTAADVPESATPDRFAGEEDYGWAEQVPDWPPGYVDPGDGPYPLEGIEHAKYRIACLEYQGMAVTPSVDGTSLMFQAGGLTMGQAFALDHECYQRAIDIGLVLDYGSTPEGLALKYEAEMQTQRCLLKNGFETVDPPSLDSYIDSGGTNWTAFDAYGGKVDVFRTSGTYSEQVQAQIACPPGEDGG